MSGANRQFNNTSGSILRSAAKASALSSRFERVVSILRKAGTEAWYIPNDMGGIAFIGR